MSLVEHAKRELELCGQAAEDPGYAASIVAAIAAFASYGIVIEEDDDGS